MNIQQSNKNGKKPPLEGEVLTIKSSELVVAQTTAEIDTQIATARRFPRELSVFKKKALAFATLDQETAESMGYYLPKGGGITGPSVRLAEIVVSTYGNLRADAKVVAIDFSHITAEGTCMDLEANTAMRVQVKMRITDKNGKRYNDDMIVTTSNAACSKAYRNAVFKCVPWALVKPIYDSALLVGRGDEKTLALRRDQALAYFDKNKVPKEKVFSLLKVKDKEDITLDHLQLLRGLINAIKDGDTTFDMAFLDVDKSQQNNNLNEILRKKREETSTELQAGVYPEVKAEEESQEGEQENE